MEPETTSVILEHPTDSVNIVPPPSASPDSSPEPAPDASGPPEGLGGPSPAISASDTPPAASPPATSPPSSELDDLPDEALQRILAKRGHDGLKHLPAWQAAQSRFLNQARRDIETQVKQQATAQTHLAQWSSYFAELEQKNPQLLVQLINSDAAAAQHLRMQAADVDRAYQAVKQFRRSGTPQVVNPETVIKTVLDNMRTYLSEHPDWSHVADDWEDVLKKSEGDPGKFFTHALEAGARNREKQLKEAYETQITALKNQLASVKHATNGGAPDSLPGNGMDVDGAHGDQALVNRFASGEYLSDGEKARAIAAMDKGFYPEYAAAAAR
jgi:hypothetical protein